MNIKFGFLALGFSIPLYAGTMGEQAPLYPWFGSIGTGYSWTRLPGINNPNPAEWDSSTQGYNSSLGNRGFYTFAVGKQVYDYVDVSVSYLDHENFNYQKFQTGVSSTPGFTGSSRNRYLNLNNRAILVNAFLHPLNEYYNAFNIGFTPFIGAGIGYALNQVNNFYTVGTTTVGGTALGSTDSIGKPVSTNSFAWQASAGLNIKPQIDHLSLDVGYRYFDGGKFYGSNLVYTNSFGWDSATPWSGKLRANQLFVEFKYTA